MDKNETIQWVVSAVIRLIAGFVAIKYGADAVSEPTWTSLAVGLGAAAVAGISIYSSVKSRKTLKAQVPPTE